MHIKKIVTSGMDENCYLIKNKRTNDGYIIDPGNDSEFLISEIKASGIKLSGVLLTHGHFDHIGAVNEITSEFKVPVYCGKEDAEVAKNPALNLAAAFGDDLSVEITTPVSNNDTLQLGDIEFKVIATPGHTPGGVCYYFPLQGILFSGDTLFRLSVGRTDFPLSSHKDLIHSVKEKLFKLPVETIVYSGHGEETTIDFEKKNNYFV